MSEIQDNSMSEIQRKLRALTAQYGVDTLIEELAVMLDGRSYELESKHREQAKRYRAVASELHAVPLCGGRPGLTDNI